MWCMHSIALLLTQMHESVLCGKLTQHAAKGGRMTMAQDAAQPLSRVHALRTADPASTVLCRFNGRIEQYDGKRKHKIDYDDGDEEWADLSKERHELLPAQGMIGAKPARSNVLSGKHARQCKHHH